MVRDPDMDPAMVLLPAMDRVTVARRRDKAIAEWHLRRAHPRDMECLLPEPRMVVRHPDRAIAAGYHHRGHPRDMQCLPPVRLMGRRIVRAATPLPPHVSGEINDRVLALSFRLDRYRNRHHAGTITIPPASWGQA